MVDRLIQLILLALAGGAGTLARDGLTSLTHWAGARLDAGPWRAAAGTLTVNILGSFLFGLIFAWTEPRLPAQHGADARVLLLVGFMGAFTTFSAFSFDAVRMVRESQWLGAGLYIAASVGLSITGLVLGLMVGARAAGQVIG